MLIPLGHERMRARRWPVITFALIALNCLVFLGTFSSIDQPSDARVHLLILAATHPELQVPAGVQSYVTRMHQQQPDLWALIQRPERKPEDAWEAHIRTVGDPVELQHEIDRLALQVQSGEGDSVIDRYGFIPAQPNPLAYLTANFLHGGWLHLIGNMWFLWLAGFVLEDVWGRVIYSIFYLVAGAAALQFHAWMYPGSMTATIGASGAVAGLMGAFLVRFPTMKIELGWLLRFRIIRFKVAAFYLLPLWVLMEILFGKALGESSGVAHWAHVGGFVFGGVVALAFKLTGVEAKVSQAVDEKITLTSEPAIREANKYMDEGHYQPAISILEQYLQIKPESLEAALLLQQAFHGKGDVAGERNALLRCCNLHLKARQLDAAWQDYYDYAQAGGDARRLPAATLLELCRCGENCAQPEVALAEYKRLIEAYPKERQSVQAQLGAARICLKKLGRPQEALRWFRAAEASPVPHLDWDAAIAAGIREATAAATPAAFSSAVGTRADRRS